MRSWGSDLVICVAVGRPAEDDVYDDHITNLFVCLKTLLSFVDPMCNTYGEGVAIVANVGAANKAKGTIRSFALLLKGSAHYFGLLQGYQRKHVATRARAT